MLVQEQIERGHELSCSEIIQKHSHVVADLQRDNEMLREENTLLRQQLGECQKSKSLMQNDLVDATRYMA